MKKQIIKTESRFLKEIGYTLHSEFFNDGTEFHCLLNRNNGFNISDTGRCYDEINERIEKLKDMVKRGVIHSFV